MEQEIRRVAELIVGAPLTRRNRRELLYCGVGGFAGAVSFCALVALLLVGLTVSASVLGTVVGLLLITIALRFSRRLGSLHRRLLKRLLGRQVEAPPSFQPGAGILGRLDRRLRDRAAWRGVWYTLIKLPAAAVQLYSIVLTACGLVDVSYPVIWVFFHNRPGAPANSLLAVIPVPFGGTFDVTSWLGTFPAAIAGAACVVAAAWLARGINAADARLIRGLLGPSSMAERVSELERTRALAVDGSAAALRRVERDLHDGAQMRLAALAMNLGMAREKLGGEEETVRELLDAAHRNAVDALADLRDLARGIHPPVLDNGLASALDTLAASSAIPATVAADIAERPAPAIETIAYFCAAELIANATKHSYANQIEISIFTERTGVLRLEVVDDGIGGADQARGTGLAGLAERVSTVDGRIEVSSPAGGPTKVAVQLPRRTGGED
ncbi:MAG: sensor domain-containing protein [Actinomycetota bacterium]|nr:sensor domain-containing protein [Actinomycetota bacterium]